MLKPMISGVSTEREGGPQVDLQNLVVHFLWEVLCCDTPLNACDVDQDLEIMLGSHGGDDFAHILDVGEIRCIDPALST